MTNFTRNFLILIAALTFAPQVFAETKACDFLEIRITDMKEVDKGQVCAYFFEKEEGFPKKFKKNGSAKVCVPISKDLTTIKIKSLPFVAGAIFLHHDKESNGEVSRNFSGIPTDGFGNSNNGGGIPTYADARFDVGANCKNRLDIKVDYIF